VSSRFGDLNKEQRSLFRVEDLRTSYATVIEVDAHVSEGTEELPEVLRKSTFTNYRKGHRVIFAICNRHTCEVIISIEPTCSGFPSLERVTIFSAMGPFLVIALNGLLPFALSSLIICCFEKFRPFRIVRTMKATYPSESTSVVAIERL